MTRLDVIVVLMNPSSGGRTTLHTRLRLDEATGKLLGLFAERFGRDLRRLNVLLSKGVPLSKAKRQFIEEGLTARQFNGVASVLRGMRASRKSSLEREIRTKTRRARALEQRLRLPCSRGGYAPGVAHQKKRVVARLRDFLKQARGRKPSLTFGGRKLWKAQHHLQENGFSSFAEWQKAWRDARSGEFFLIGSKDESFGNQSCQWDPRDRCLKLRLPDHLGGSIEIPGLSFPYQEALLERAVLSGIAVSYRFVRKPKGWYLYASTHSAVGEICTNRSLGVLGVDVGPGSVAAVETDRAGNPVSRRTFPLPLYRKTKTQARALIGEIAAEVGAWAVRSGKPVALEELDFEGKKAELRERGKGYARRLSSFAYGALSEAIHSRAARMGVDLISVDPAYSSTMGLIKYSAMYGFSGDEAAALVLARRAMNLGESLPAGTALGRPEDRSRHVWEHWQRLGKALRSKGRHAFAAAIRGPGGRRVHPVFPARASPA